jgi:hypothetical protein
MDHSPFHRCDLLKESFHHLRVHGPDSLDASVGEGEVDGPWSGDSLLRLTEVCVGEESEISMKK